MYIQIQLYGTNYPIDTESGSITLTVKIAINIIKNGNWLIHTHTHTHTVPVAVVTEFKNSVLQEENWGFFEEVVHSWFYLLFTCLKDIF